LRPRRADSPRPNHSVSTLTPPELAAGARKLPVCGISATWLDACRRVHRQRLAIPIKTMPEVIGACATGAIRRVFPSQYPQTYGYANCRSTVGCCAAVSSQWIGVESCVLSSSLKSGAPPVASLHRFVTCTTSRLRFFVTVGSDAEQRGMATRHFEPSMSPAATGRSTARNPSAPTQKARLIEY